MRQEHLFLNTSTWSLRLARPTSSRLELGRQRAIFLAEATACDGEALHAVRFRCYPLAKDRATPRCRLKCPEVGGIITAGLAGVADTFWQVISSVINCGARDGFCF